MNVFLGDGSFADCVRLGVFAQECEGDIEEYLAEDSFMRALYDERVPLSVFDYAGLVMPVFDYRFLKSKSVSAPVIVDHLKRDYHGDEIVSRNMTYEFSECFASLGKRQYRYKLFEKTGAEARIDRGTAYANHNVRMAFSREQRIGMKALDAFSNDPDPVKYMEQEFDISSEMRSYQTLFFNKHLTFLDMMKLWNSMLVESDGHFQGFYHFFLLQSVLLRNDWTSSEVEKMYEMWRAMSKLLAAKIPKSLLNEYTVENDAAKMLFALNESTPLSLLLKLFANSGTRVRDAVVQNPAVGESFVRVVLDGDVSEVSKTCGVEISGECASSLRASAVKNPVLLYEDLVKVFENEGESVSVRFGALFNENIPSFVRELYC